jgi:hypothetical protein
MKKLLSLAAVAGLLAVSTPAALAQMGSRGASGFTPGHQMQRFGSVPGHPGASGFAPGHRFVHHHGARHHGFIHHRFVHHHHRFVSHHRFVRHHHRFVMR